MSLKTYSAHTLSDNWFEDRAPPLKSGVLADYGDRSMSTTAKSDLKKPTAHAEFFSAKAAKRRQPRYGMVTAATFDEATLAYGDVTAAHTFGSLIQTHKPDVDKFEMATTAQVSFGVPSRPTRAEEKAMRSTQARTAGAPVRAEKGLSASGAIGEVLKLDADVSANTGVQRSWLYGGDPGLSATVRPPKPAPDATYMSLPITEGALPAGVSHRGPDGRFVAKPRTAIITQGQKEMNLKRGFRVFNDDP